MCLDVDRLYDNHFMHRLPGTTGRTAYRIERSKNFLLLFCLFLMIAGIKFTRQVYVSQEQLKFPNKIILVMMFSNFIKAILN